MAFLHCHGKNCGWSQDDFWRKGGYNPISFLAHMEEDLFKEKIHFDPQAFIDLGVVPKQDEEGYYMTGRDYVAAELERHARTIRGMAVPTEEEWKIVKDTWKCPKCGSSDWDID